MTIELLELPDLPAGSISAARIVVAVPGALGAPPSAFQAPLGSGVPGPAGTGFAYRGAWAATTAYATNDVVTNAGQTYVTVSPFTSGSTFDTVHLAIWAAKGADGAAGASGTAGVAGANGAAGATGPGFTFRGAWTASTSYAARDVLTNGGQTYVVTTAFASSGSFDATNLSLWAAKGTDGATGPAGPSNSYTLPPATTSQLGGIKSDGVTLNIASDGTASVAGTAVTVLPDISTLGGPALSDIIALNRGGVDYKTTPAAVRGLYGIQRIDLKAVYRARCDGTSHPLSGTYSSLAAAQSVYPNAGLTSGNWSAMEIDTAAWLQAEYDVRTGSAGAGIIGLNDGASMMVSQTLYLQASALVWFHGGRNVVLNTAACGTTPAIRVSGAYGSAIGAGQSINPLHQLNLLASTSLSPASITGAGAKYTGYVTGARAFQIDNVIAADFTSLSWAGYDRPILWGTNAFGLAFRNWSAGLNNVGWNWDQTVALNSMERIRLISGSAANNNVGVDINATYSGANQAGSLFIHDNDFDYNIQRQIQFVGLASGTYNAICAMRVTENHFETTGGCSGTNPRCTTQGTAFFQGNEFFENDGTHPTGYIQVADYSALSLINNRMDVDRLPLSISGSAAFLTRVEGYGNVGQNPNQPVYLLKCASGTYIQQSKEDGEMANITADPNPMAPEQAHTRKLLAYTSAGNYTIDTFASAGVPVNTVLFFDNIGSTVTFVGKTSAVSFYAPVGGPNLANGGSARLLQYSVDQWLILGTGLS